MAINSGFNSSLSEVNTVSHIHLENSTPLTFSSSDIKGVSLNENGQLLISLKNDSTVMIDNFRELVQSGQSIGLADGGTLDPRILYDNLSATSPNTVYIAQPAAGATTEYNLQPGQNYELAFAKNQPGEHFHESNGTLVITFADNGTIILKNFHEAMNMTDGPQILIDGKDVALKDFAQTVGLGTNEQDADIAQQLANVEPAAGGNSGGAGGGHGYGFQSAFDDAAISRLAAQGPIGDTNLNFGTPAFQTNLIDIRTNADDNAVNPPLPALAARHTDNLRQWRHQ